MSVINDDLNMPRALEVFWKVLDDFDFSPKKKIKLLERFDKVLGLCVKEMREIFVRVPKEVRELVVKRDKLREKKKWAEADIIRERIRDKGFVLEDISSGVKVSKA